MKKQRIKKADSERLLLTEVLPYETPIFFSNEGLYNFTKKHKATELKAAKIIKEKILTKNKGHTIPYNYRINKNHVSTRTLSIIHPAAQIEASNFIHNHDSLIISLCSKSQCSLRYPSKVASHFYEKEYAKSDSETEERKVETETTEASQEKYASSYFTYKDFSFIYKFYDSYLFHRAERKYKHLLKFDISKCFPHIYTHSICWATKSKEFAKSHKGKNNFENNFDSLMQRCNYSETNGIVVGPEISRIFAEIIFQDIDRAVIKKLAELTGLQHDRDYIVKRYVDDYFLFHNSEDAAKTIFNAFQEELEKYKLYVNESKNEEHIRPFISNITTAKIEVGNLISEFTDNNTPQYLNDPIITKDRIYDPSRSANFLIRDFKSIIKKNNADFSSSSGKAFSIIRKKINSILEDAAKAPQEQRGKAKNLLLTLIELSFFICSMDLRVRSTYNIAQIVSTISRHLKIFDFDTNDHIQKKIHDELISTIKSRSSANTDTIETINLILIFNYLNRSLHLKPTRIIEFLGSGVENGKILQIENLDYFKLVTILFCTQKVNSAATTSFRSQITHEAVNRITNSPDFLENTELTCLFLDICSNPKIEKLDKQPLLEALIKKTKKTAVKQAEINELMNFFENNFWFVDWKSGVNLSHYLEKKELQIVY